MSSPDAALDAPLGPPAGPGAPAAPARAHLGRDLLADLRWTFTWPFTWLSGVGINLVLSLLYLVVFPLTGHPHRDWAILVGSYFAVFVLADVTTTNVLGADAARVGRRLADRTPLARILVVKNLVLLLVVGLPTLVTTGIITVLGEPGYRLEVTLPGVLFPVLAWLGVGNLVSVALPVATVPLKQRWSERHRRAPTLRWLVSLGLPYLLVTSEDPMNDLPGAVLRGLGLPRAGETDVKGVVLVALGAVFYAAGTGAALAVAHRRGVRMDRPR